ncbi:MAG: hypothetical protein QOF18_1129 [Frankiaceae bacterium]|jgi:hypothetical protein|nr:hypothetical protein [Frankiaceae bacterium]
MTELLSRTTSSNARYDDEALPSMSVWLRGSFAALWAVAVGVATLVVVVLVAWAADSRAGSGATAAIRTGLQIWLVAHRIPLRVAGGSIAIAPLLLTLGLAFLVARSAAVLARGQGVKDLTGVGTVALAVGLPYGALTTFVAAAAHSPAVSPAPIVALFAGLALGCGAAAWGAVRGAGLGREAWTLLPASVRLPLGAGAAALAVLFAGATLVLLAALSMHVAEASQSLHVLGGGAVAAVAVVALDLALLPNAAVCVLGYLAGPGFAVGGATSVTVNGSHAGSLPALPLMSAVPRGPAPLAVELVGIVVLVVAGIVAAWIVARAELALVRSMGLALGAGAAAGLLAAVLAAFAAGPAGPGRLAVVGTSPWQTGLAVAGEVAIVACGAAGAFTWRRGR